MDGHHSYSESLLPPKVREAMKQSPRDQMRAVPGRPYPRERHSPSTARQTKSDGHITFLMPIYTFVILVVFIYTIYRVFFKKKWTPDRDMSDEPVNPIIKDFNLDPEYLNRVMAILEDVKRHGNWHKALNENILPRKTVNIDQPIIAQQNNERPKIEKCDNSAPKYQFESGLRLRRRKSF